MSRPAVENSVDGDVPGTLVQAATIHSLTIHGSRERTVPAQLPVLPTLVGREVELSRLGELLAPGEDSATTRVAVLTGVGGVGKTALAVAWILAHRDRFADGQLYVNLGGFGPPEAAVPVDRALRSLLTGLGVDVRAVPDDLEDKAALYRSLTAGRRLAVLLDNAADRDDLTPLVPGPPGRVLVTGRGAPPGLLVRGAPLIQVAPLPEAEAEALLRERLRTRGVAGDDPVLGRLARRCHGLPLAIGLIAGHAVGHPSYRLSEIEDDLDESGVIGLTPDGGAADLARVFSWSYGQLQEDEGRAFRLLAASMGATISTPDAAALLGLPRERTKAVLRALVRVSLLQEVARGRFALHDLVREYGAALEEPADERLESLRRLCDQYVATAAAAGAVLLGGTPSNSPRRAVLLPPPLPTTRVPDVPDSRAAAAWFVQEGDNLLGAFRLAVAAGDPAPAFRLAYVLDGPWVWFGRLEDVAALWTEVLPLIDAERAPAPRVAATRLAGLALSRLDQQDAARAHLEESARVAAAAGDTLAEADAHLSLSFALERLGHPLAAVGHARRAHAMFAADDQRSDRAFAAGRLGALLGSLGHLDEALTWAEQGLDEIRRTGDADGEADLLDVLGTVRRARREYAVAVDSHRAALRLYREVGDTFGEADALDNLGLALAGSGAGPEAGQAWRDAAVLFRTQGRLHRLRPPTEPAH